MPIFLIFVPWYFFSLIPNRLSRFILEITLYLLIIFIVLRQGTSLTNWLTKHPWHLHTTLSPPLTTQGASLCPIRLQLWNCCLFHFSYVQVNRSELVAHWLLSVIYIYAMWLYWSRNIPRHPCAKYYPLAVFWLRAGSSSDLYRPTDICQSVSTIESEIRFSPDAFDR